MKKTRGKTGRPARDGAPAAAVPEAPYPYTRDDVAAFFTRNVRVRIAYVKVERSLDDFGDYLCEAVLTGADEQRLLLQGVRFSRRRFRYPPHLAPIPPAVRNALERKVLQHLIEARVVASRLEAPELAYDGRRVVPVTAPFHAYWVHALRYAFAAERCAGKHVLDLGCGSGYGTRILARRAASCLGVDLDPEAVALARSLFGGPNVCFAVGDVTRLAELPDASREAVVALELLEHLPFPQHPAFFAAVRRVLEPDGLLILSVAGPAPDVPGTNPDHAAEMSFAHFREVVESELRPASAAYFEQQVWEGSYRLEQEGRIRPVTGAAPAGAVFIAVARPGTSGGTVVPS